MLRSNRILVVVATVLGSLGTWFVWRTFRSAQKSKLSEPQIEEMLIDEDDLDWEESKESSVNEAAAEKSWLKTAVMAAVYFGLLFGFFSLVSLGVPGSRLRSRGEVIGLELFYGSVVEPVVAFAGEEADPVRSGCTLQENLEMNLYTPPFRVGQMVFATPDLVPMAEKQLMTGDPAIILKIEGEIITVRFLRQVSPREDFYNWAWFTGAPCRRYDSHQAEFLVSQQILIRTPAGRTAQVTGFFSNYLVLELPDGKTYIYSGPWFGYTMVD